MNMKKETETYFINSIALFCIKHKVEDIYFHLKMELFFNWVFINYNTSFMNNMGIYESYKEKLRYDK